MQSHYQSAQAKEASSLMGHAAILIILIAMCMIIASGCRKANIPAPLDSAGMAFKNINAPVPFNWNTYRSVNVNIAALATNSTVAEKLEVYTEAGLPLVALHTLLSQPHQLRLMIPSATQKLRITCGTIDKTIGIENGQVFFDYITPIPAAFE
jgi:hypothetical protein